MLQRRHLDVYVHHQSMSSPPSRTAIVPSETELPRHPRTVD